MLDAISAESLKLTRHKATWFLVWLYPVGFFAIFLAAIVAGLVAPEPPAQAGLQEWLFDTAVIWYIPGNALGRYLIAAFAAVAFAGEYGWNTWKLIVPHRARFALIAAKYVVVVALLAIAFALTALLSVLGTSLEDVITGDPLPAGITAGALFEVHGEAALSALAPGLLTVAYASLAAILTRSTIAALVIAIVAVSIEQLIFNFGPILYMKSPALVWGLYHALPGYHLDNLTRWIREGAGAVTEFPFGATVALGWATSLAVTAAWIGGLAALTVASFKRQDIN